MTLDPGHLTEFYAGFTGTCGECALEDAIAATNHRKASEDDMVALTHEMQNHGQASPNGASTLWALAREAERRGETILLEWDYAEPFPHDWHQVLLDNAGVNPIILEYAVGGNLVDQETGAHDEVGLHYHYNVILGKQADGYIDNDGDNPQVLSRYQVYSYADLASAQPCGLLMLKTKEKPVVDTTGLGPGFAAYVTEHNVTAKCVTGTPANHELPYANGDTFAAFDNGLVLTWSAAQGVHDTDAAWVIFSLLDEIAKLKAQPPSKPLPSSIHAALVSASQLLTPYAAASADVAQALKDLGQ